ncbi:retrotransposon protein, putative, ty1-copia subclass [Tanacetum coccineum]|uniref:Retrotransposon protein, putative, ty1-copia subclass n=1 Tax=Tanacetum coccineum TaxID=301880 RepID=A0ABQ4XLE2_9ASTR
MAASMIPELQKTFENTWAYEMNQQLKEMFQAKASKEHLDVVKSLMACKPKPRASICAFVLELKGYFDSLMQTAEQGIKKSDVPSTSAAPVLNIGHNAKKRKTSHSNWKGKATQGKSDRGSKRKVDSEIAPTGDPKEAVCFYCNTKGHWKHSWPKYLKDLKDEKVKKGGHSASPCKGIYETVECIDNGNVILNVGSSNELDKLKLWHSRLGHINKKRIAQLQKDGVLESFDFKSDDVCESCLLGKMTKSPFTRTCKRGEGLLDLVHTDVYGPFRSATKDGKRYYVTFIDDFSRYGYVYLIKHKSDTFEMFKRYQNEVENQLGKKIKVLQSDKGGEYLSIEFFDHLKNCGIVSQLSPPRTPQLNGVAERRNRTLLDMVRSMMCRATLPISFWGYALETANHILNLVPTKKVSKTPFEMWKGKRPSLRHIKIWGCEVFNRREAQDKLKARSEKCLFVGYPEESFGYLFYRPKDNMVFVAQSADEEPIVNTDTQQEVVTPVEPDDISLPIRKISSKVSKPSQDPQFYYGFHIEEDKISDSTLIDLNEPANYKETMACPEAAK